MGWTPEQMASYLSVVVDTYKGNESKGTGSRNKAIEYAKKMHVSLDWLLGDEENDMWGSKVRRARAMLLLAWDQIPACTVFDDRVTWLLRWLEGLGFSRPFLSGLCYCTPEALGAVMDKRLGDDILVPQSAIARLSAFLAIPEECIFDGVPPSREVNSSWVPVVMELERRCLRESDVLDCVEILDLVISKCRPNVSVGAHAKQPLRG